MSSDHYTNAGVEEGKDEMSGTCRDDAIYRKEILAPTGFP